MKAMFFIVLILGCSFTAYMQAEEAKNHYLNNVGIYGMYGRHGHTDYNQLVGNTFLVPARSIAVNIAVKKNFPLSASFFVSSGLTAHLFVPANGYGLMNPDVDDLPSYIRPNNSGFFGNERVSIGLPVQMGVKKELGEKTTGFIKTGPIMQTYGGLEEKTIDARPYWDDNGARQYAYFILRTYDDYPEEGSRRFSKPKLEWRSEIGANYAIKKVGRVGLSLIHHMGTKKLESAQYLIFWHIPELQSGGTFEFNRSYLGAAFTFTFVKNKKLPDE